MCVLCVYTMLHIAAPFSCVGEAALQGCRCAILRIQVGFAFGAGGEVRLRARRRMDGYVFVIKCKVTPG